MAGTRSSPWISRLQLNDYSDEPSKLATEYSPQEIAFFRIIVRATPRLPVQRRDSLAAADR